MHVTTSAVTDPRGIDPQQVNDFRAVTGAPDRAYWEVPFGRRLREVFPSCCGFLAPTESSLYAGMERYFFPSQPFTSSNYNEGCRLCQARFSRFQRSAASSSSPALSSMVWVTTAPPVRRANSSFLLSAESGTTCVKVRSFSICFSTEK